MRLPDGLFIIPFRSGFNLAQYRDIQHAYWSISVITADEYGDNTSELSGLPLVTFEKR